MRIWLKKVWLENDFLRVCVLPEYGAKIVEIRDKRVDYQWLWTDPTRPIRPRSLNDNYADHDITGFDECFPNIGISPYPLDNVKLLPDHGELWSQSWEYERSDLALKTFTYGLITKYKFVRTISLESKVLNFEYQIQNLSDETLVGLWSAHPLFTAQEGMHIEIKGNPRMTKEFGFSSRMGDDGIDGYKDHLRPFTWPITVGSSGEKYDISLISLARPLTDKVVIESPEDGEIRLVNPAFGCAIRFNFDPAKIPYSGICFNLNAWPFEGEKGCWLAIEPTQGATDRLDESADLGAFLNILPGETAQFMLRLTLEVL
jgi:galactose mutarotase-like enzyme